MSTILAESLSSRPVSDPGITFINCEYASDVFSVTAKTKLTFFSFILEAI
jgi:hypothetical protein